MPYPTESYNTPESELPSSLVSDLIIISDEKVAELHLEAVEAALRPHVRKLHSATVPAGEASKSFASLEKLSNEILDLNIDRRALIVALGGGVVGDLAGFVAASLLKMQHHREE